MSQSLYIVSFAVFDYRGLPVPVDHNGQPLVDLNSTNANEFFRTGFSCLGILLVLVVGSVILLVSWLDDLRRLPSGMPLVATCSAAISASCHAISKHPEEMVRKPFRWGAVSLKNGVAHCSFTDDVDAVAPPKNREVIARDGVTFCPRRWRLDNAQAVTNTNAEGIMLRGL